MLIAFSVENFRSYQDRQELSMLAGSGTELMGNTLPVKDVAALASERVLKAVGIYGANASGKSNLVRAMSTFCRIISRSAKESIAKDLLPVSAFALSAEARRKPTRFSATFVVENVLYEYTAAMTRARVEFEQLIAFPKKVPQELYRRSCNADGKAEWHFSRTHFRRDKELERRTRPNSLYVSVGAHFNHELLSKLYEFFVELDIREPRSANDEFRETAERCLSSRSFREWAGRLLRGADTGIESLMAKAADVTERIPSDVRRQMAPSLIKKLRTHPIIEAVHRVHGSKELIHWSFGQESDGTQQLFSLLRSYHETIRGGGTVIVDELDNSLHSLLSRTLLQMVHDPKMNPKGGQLIFTTHDTTLLDPTLLRRDQIYFTERSSAGATRLYSLLEYMPRKDEALQKGYLAGRYGAVPFLGEFRFGPEKASQLRIKH